MLKFLKLLVFACIVSIPGAALLTEIVLYSQNSLYLNDRWIAEKRMMKMGLVRGDEYLLTRTPLARNMLDLGRYHGYQEVIYRDALDLSALEFDFYIDDESYLDVTYNRDENGYSGVRLSRRQDMPSFAFESTARGGFRSKRLIPIKNVEAGWHKALMRSSSSGLALVIDRASIDLPSAARLGSGRIGFFAGMEGATIDNVIIQPSSGTPIQETFRNSKRWQPLLAWNFALLLVFTVLLTRITAGKLGLATKRGFFSLTLISLVTLLCTGWWFAFDYFFYSRRIPRNSGITHPIAGNDRFSFPSFERVRFLTFQEWYRLAGGETVSHAGVTARGYPKRIFQGPAYCGLAAQESCVEGLPPAAAAQKLADYRILFIGSSQTIGAGARALDETFFVGVHDYLKKELAPKATIESINGGISGYRAADLLAEYKSRFNEFKPDLVLINLSYNDGRSRQKFFAAMESFLEFNKASGIKTILVEEPYSPELPVQNKILANHQALRDLGAKYGVPVLSLHGYLTEFAGRQNGRLWWDQVHLTSYGHEITAAWLAPQVLKSLLAVREPNATQQTGQVSGPQNGRGF